MQSSTQKSSTQKSSTQKSSNQESSTSGLSKPSLRREWYGSQNALGDFYRGFLCKLIKTEHDATFIEIEDMLSLLVRNDFTTTRLRHERLPKQELFQLKCAYVNAICIIARIFDFEYSVDDIIRLMNVDV